MSRTLSITISAEHLARIKEMLRTVLGRELTAEEERYLGLSRTQSRESNSEEPAGSESLKGRK